MSSFGGAHIGRNIIKALGPWAWYRMGTGIISDPTTKAVSQWEDSSENAHHLNQPTVAKRPQLQPDGSILFDGVSHSLFTDTAPLIQPTTIIALYAQVSWLSGDNIFDGFALNTGAVFQNNLSSQIRMRAALGIGNVDPGVGSYGITVAGFNGASSFLQKNNSAPVIGDVGAGDMNGFTLATNASSGANNGTNCGNIQVQEIIIFPKALDTNAITRVMQYLIAAYRPAGISF